MANLTRHKFSSQEISELQKVVEDALLDVDNAKKALGQIKVAKMTTRQKYEKGAHRYR